MPRLLPPALIRDIQLMLDARFTRRDIASRLDVSRGVVDQVARGDRKPSLLASTDEDRPVLSVRRCPDCGNVVEMPCRACQVRELVAGGHLFQTLHLNEPYAKLDLQPEEHERYLQVRRWRRERARAALRGPHASSH